MNIIIKIFIFILVFLMFYNLFIQQILRLRYKYSFMFGRFEHAASRICFVFIFLSIISLILTFIELTLFFLYCSIISWIIYWCCHRLEKTFHPNH
jgi:hypothetical protein